MDSRLCVFTIAVLVLLVMTAMPVQARCEEIKALSMDMAGVDVTDPKPGYQKTAGDYINDGTCWKERCEQCRYEYDQVQRNFAEDYSAERGRSVDYVNYFTLTQQPVVFQYATMIALGLTTTYPEAAVIYTDMVESCEAAEQNYNKAYELTAADDYRQQALIFNEGAGVYETLGDHEGASKVRKAETAALERARTKETGYESDCLIVTATFGSPLAAEVQLVRNFRDDTIKQDYLGSRYVTALNAIYYSFSPAVARSINANERVKPAMRIVLAPLIGIVLLSQEVYLLLAFSPELATITFILLGGFLVGTAYILPFMLPAVWIFRRRSGSVPALSGLVPFVILWAGLLAALLVGAFLRIDAIAITGSGMLFSCTAVLAPVAVSLYIMGRIAVRPGAAGR